MTEALVALVNDLDPRADQPITELVGVREGHMNSQHVRFHNVLDIASKLAPNVQWQHSYVAADRTFCIYVAEDEQGVREHARLSGFPANRIIEIGTIIDPTTADAA